MRTSRPDEAMNRSHPFFPRLHPRQDGSAAVLENMPREKPFRVELFRTDERDGKFTPAARFLITRTLRTSGFLRDLPDAEAKTLLLLVTFLRPDGRCEVTVTEAATALTISSTKAQARLERLMATSFDEQPVLRAVRRDSGLDGYVLTSALVDEQPALPETPSPEPSATLPAHRPEIVAHSRARYANPRAEVEALILTQQLGYTPATPVDTSTPEGAARQAMAEVGLRAEKIDLLIESFPIEAITRQIEWLPHRHPKDAAKLLVSAIRYDYEPPAFIRLQQAVAADEPAQTMSASKHRAGESNGTPSPPEPGEA